MTNPNKPNSADKWQKIAQEAESQIDENETQADTGTEEESRLDYPTRQQLEDQLTSMERNVEEYKKQVLLAKAELENVRRRAERDISNERKYGVEQLLQSLLPVVDGLVRGLESQDPQDSKIKAIRDGMQLTLDILHKVLIKFGVEIIDPQPGEPFDPKLHEAMGMRHDPNAKPNTILQVLQKGYQLHGRVLRAAMVMVAQ